MVCEIITCTLEFVMTCCIISAEEGHGANISVTRSPFFTTVLELQENFKCYDAIDPTHIKNNARLSQFESAIFSLF